MSIFETVLLGLLQGLTEFLPVSSSGHLVLGQAWLGLVKNDIFFEVFVHFGTFLAVLVVFWNDIIKLIGAVVHWLNNLSNTSELFRSDVYLRMALFIIIGSIPAAIFGLALESTFESIFSRPLMVSGMLVVTGIILLMTKWAQTKRHNVNIVGSMIMGIAQAAAIIPGISRSGATISAGMYLGIEKYEAARFSFLLSLPAILGATILKTIDLIKQPLPDNQIWNLLTGTIVAFISGYLAIRFLLNLIRKGKFSYFAFYCFAIAIIGLLYFK